MFVSNCHSEFRREWLKGLMEAIAVDSFGSCLRTRTLPEALRQRETRGDVDEAFERRGAEGTAQEGQSDVKMLVTSRYAWCLCDVVIFRSRGRVLVACKPSSHKRITLARASPGTPSASRSRTRASKTTSPRSSTRQSQPPQQLLVPSGHVSFLPRTNWTRLVPQKLHPSNLSHPSHPPPSPPS
jgi:hypothetical protein